MIYFITNISSVDITNVKIEKWKMQEFEEHLHVTSAQRGKGGHRK